MTVNMMKRFAVLVMTSLLAACDGLTVPDGDDMADLTNAVAGLPADQQETLERHKQNDLAGGYLVSVGGDLSVMRCKERPDIRGAARADVLEQTLRTFREWGIPQIAQWMEVRAQAELERAKKDAGYNGPCTPEYEVTQEGHEMFAEAEERLGSGPGGTARWLVGLQDIAARPEVMAIVGVAVVGGVIVATGGGAALIGAGAGAVGLALCPLSETIACPDDPGAPDVSQQTPRGDR